MKTFPLAAWPAFGQGLDVKSAALQILWSIPVTAMQFPELANVSAGAKLLWRRKIPDAWSNEDTGSFCGNFTMTRLARGDALLACRLNGSIHLYEADAATGDFQEAQCHSPPVATATRA